MATNYCDYINGNDDTGDGSKETPYQTITKASTDLTGGDEVRVAKSPAPTALTGTLGFTAGSTAVVGTDTLFSSELVIGDFISGGDEQWWEVVVITDNTHATLFKVYSGTTESGVSSQKLGITSTGEAEGSSTVVQQIMSSGVSSASRLKISGGWNLTTEEQDGQTFFRQMHGTFANRYGWGMYASGLKFLEIERLHFLRYTNGSYFSSITNCIITGMNCSSNGAYGLYLLACSVTTITDPVCNCNMNHSLFINGGYNDTILNPRTDSNETRGICIANNANSIVVEPVCRYNGSGCYVSVSSNIAVIKYSGTGNISHDIWVPSLHHMGSDFPMMKCQQYQLTPGDNRCLYEYGITYRDTAEARSTQCLKYDPISATYYISQSFFFAADSGVAQTLSAYIKKEAAFNGDVQGAIFFLGTAIAGWTTITPTENDTYEQKSLVAAAEDITEDGVLELKIKCRGTAGNVYVDDLDTA